MYKILPINQKNIKNRFMFMLHTHSNLITVPKYNTAFMLCPPNIRSLDICMYTYF